MIDIRPPTDVALEYVAERMCEADRAEVLAASTHGPHAAIRRGFEKSYQCWVAWFPETTEGPLESATWIPRCVFGIACADDGTGVPWMLGDGNYKAYRKSFLQASRQVIANWEQNHPVLFNFVDVRNMASFRWLSWLGFEARETVEEYGHAGIPFHLMVRDSCVE